jgi:GTP cyclohydrolase I
MVAAVPSNPQTDRCAMINLTYQRFGSDIVKLAARIKGSPGFMKGVTGIYGVPRGGVPVALGLAGMLRLPLRETAEGRGTLVVDDICDSGRTLERYPGRKTATLFTKPHAGFKPTVWLHTVTDWVRFPWELHETPAQDAIVRVLEVIGEDPNREGLLDTPARVVRSYETLYGGYKQDPKKILSRTFEGDGYDQIVLLDNIDFHSTCEHHLLPFFGRAHVAYIPRNRVVGLSKLARVVECFSRRLQIQERMTQQIATALTSALDPLAVGVVVQAQHFCMVARGVQKKNAVMTTSALRGLFKDDSKARGEFLALIGKGRA